MRCAKGGFSLSSEPITVDEEAYPWPRPPEGFTSFQVVIHRVREKGDAQKPRYARLKALSADELAWVLETISVELKRRKVRVPA